MMTLKQLREHIAKISPKYDNLEVKVWLPGSTIRLSPMIETPYNGKIMIEGNVDPGSALDDSDTCKHCGSEWKDHTCP